MSQANAFEQSRPQPQPGPTPQPNAEAAEQAQARAEQHQRLFDRIELLKLRTALVGVLGFLMLAAAALACVSLAPQALRAVQSLWESANAVHLPSNLFADLGNTSRVPLVLQLAFVAIALLGVSTISRNGMSDQHQKMWLVLLVGIGGAAVVLQISSDGNRSAERGLKAALAKQDWGEANRLLPRDANALGARYVHAQMALAQGDTQGVREQGQALMPALESILLRTLPDGPEAGGAMYQPTRDFRASVLQRIDIATYGAAHSELSIALAHGRGVADARGWVRVAKVLAGFLLACAALGFAAALLWLWARMSRRVRAVSAWAAVAAVSPLG